MTIECKRCGSNKVVKNGMMCDKQRHKCKDCELNFVLGDERVKYGTQDKLKVLKLYLENCGIRSIERLTGIRNSQISKWIEGAANEIREELTKQSKQVKSIRDVSIMEVDELCTYIKKDPRTEENSSISGLLLIENQLKLLILR